MKQISKSDLQKYFQDYNFTEKKEFVLPPNSFLEPDALAFLAENNILLKTESVSLNKYIGPSGEFYDKKPEFMTSLRGNNLVYKDDNRIFLRGKLDSLHASILQVQFNLTKLEKKECVSDLNEISDLIKKIISCEVTEQPLPEVNILGLHIDEVHKQSHFPKKYYNCSHFLPDFDSNETIILLNSLRANVREVELFAYKTFKLKDGNPSRKDIILLLNRISSVLYVMMLKEKNNEY